MPSLRERESAEWCAVRRDSWSQGCRVQEGAKEVVVVPLIVRLDWLVIFRAPIPLNVGILCYNAVVRVRVHRP